MKAEVIKRVADREYMVEVCHKNGIAYGHFTHIGQAKDKFVFTSGDAPKIDENTTKVIREEIRRFEVLGHKEYKNYLAR